MTGIRVEDSGFKGTALFDEEVYGRPSRTAVRTPTTATPPGEPGPRVSWTVCPLTGGGGEAPLTDFLVSTSSRRWPSGGPRAQGGPSSALQPPLPGWPRWFVCRQSHSDSPSPDSSILQTYFVTRRTAYTFHLYPFTTGNLTTKVVTAHILKKVLL